MKRYPDIAVIYGDLYIINAKGEITDIYKASEYSFEELLCVELVPPAQAAFIRRTALEKVGFWADTTLDTCPDYEIWLRIAMRFPMKHIWGVITKYRRHDDIQLDSKERRTVQRFIDAKKKTMDRILKSPKTPKKIRKLIHRAYASLDIWAYQTAMSMRQYRLAGYYLFHSFMIRPSFSTLKIIIYMLRLFIYSLLTKPIYTLKIIRK
jgi:hypothetical protein